jgi:Fic family protein
MFVAEAPGLAATLRDLDPKTIYQKVFLASEEVVAPGYLHWDKLRHLQPPDGLNHLEWWLATKLARRPLLRRLPLTDPEGQPFYYAVPDEVFRLLHYVDQHLGGAIGMAEVVTADSQARQHYMVNSLMEEAIRSSQLEGATTSRRVAKELLRSGREPRDRSERMILNNYRALQFMRESIGSTLTPDAVLTLQRILTEGTLDDPDAAGRLQRPGEERVAVYDRQTGDLIHRPPPADQLPDRLERLCDFANHQPDEDEPFMHPVVRGVVLHFWIGYDHPFEDGNGRTARALFYWYMRSRGYWLVEYLTISNILRKAPSKYMKAFVYTETDERDTTYFLLYQLEVVERAVKELHAYLAKKMAAVRSVEQLIKGSTQFNHRQLALLSAAVRDHGHVYTMHSHAASHNVTHETARSDLAALTDRGLLERRRAGRRYVFRPPADLVDRLKALD